jgi:hypothetical protein
MRSVSWGWESAGSAATFTGPVASPDTQERAAAAATTKATAERPRALLYTASLLHAACWHVDPVVEYL